MRARTFARRAEAETYLASQPIGAEYLARTEAVIPNPGHAAERLRAKGVLTETPLELLAFADAFAVPVALQSWSGLVTAADGSEYAEISKIEGVDALADDVAYAEVSTIDAEPLDAREPP